MITQRKDELRIQYLARVLVQCMNSVNGEGTIDYDDTTCDGSCLAEDIFNEVGKNKRIIYVFFYIG